MKGSKIILLAIVALAASAGISQAQSLLVRFPLNDTGPGATFACDPTGQANGFAMSSYNKSGVASDFHGTPGGGVSGLQVALDFSSNSDFTAAGEGGATTAGPIAAVTNAALNFGFVSAFTATIWIKPFTNMPSTNAGALDGGATGDWDLGPRIFILGSPGTADKAVANSIGLFYQQWNCLSYTIGTSQIALPCFTSPVNAAGDAFVPTNQWLFYAITYDGGNVATVYSGTDQSAVTTVLATTSSSGVLSAAQVTADGAFIGADQLASTPQNIGPGAAGMPDTFTELLANGANNSVLYIGNRPGGARSFDGRINDFQFYSGQASASFVEDIRWSAVAPTNLAYTLNAQNQPVLTWNALGSAASYNVYSYLDITGPTNQIAANVVTTNYTDTTATAGYTYHYLVTAVDAAGDATTSAYSPAVTVPVSPTPPPSVPVVTATPGNGQVALTWPASTGSGLSSVDYYTVSASTTSGGEFVIASVTAPTASYTDTGLLNGAEYFFQVSATSTAGATSANSTEVNATPIGPPEAPSASAAGSGTTATVTWTDPNPPSVTNVDTYIILSSVNSGAFEPIHTNANGTSSYVNKGLTVGDTYSYEVEVVDNNGNATSAATATFTASATSEIQDIAEQTVRGGTFANAVLEDNNSGSVPQPGNAAAIGFLRVKWISDTLPTDATSCAKSYFRWSFAGATNRIPNTNADLTLTWTTAANSAASEMIVWSLDQPYQFSTGVTAASDDASTALFTAPGGTNAAVTWENAQANDTNYAPTTYVGNFQMFQAANAATNTSPYTATPVATIANANGANTAPAAVAVIRAPWGNLIHNNEVVLCVAGTNSAATQGSAGYRINNNSAALIYNQLIGSAPPTLSAIPNLTLSGGQTSATIPLTVTDPAGNVSLINTATAVTLAAVNGFGGDSTGGGGTSATVTGSGASQQLTVTAGPNSGTAQIEVTITDEFLDSAQQTFTVTVTQPLHISNPAPTNTVGTTPVVVPFAIVDTSGPESQLTVTPSVDAQSTAVLASATVVEVGSTTNWTVTITPTGATDGIGFVDLTVTDQGGFTSSAVVTVMVRANAAVVLSDTFNYTSGSALLIENGSVYGTPPTVNDGIWNEIGPQQAEIVVTTTGSVTVADQANGDVAYANLLGEPYTVGHGYVIYTTFQANWSEIAASSWMGLGEFSAVGGFQRAAVGVAPDAAGDGNFNVQIANGPGGAPVSLTSSNLALNTTYNIATRYVVDTAESTIWVNANSETDPNGVSVSATDAQPPVQIADVTLSQAGAGVSVVMDDLTVVVPPFENHWQTLLGASQRGNGD